MNPVIRNWSPSTVHTPLAIMSLTYQIVPDGLILMSCGMPPRGTGRYPSTLWVWVSTFTSWLENSQVAMKYRPSAEKSTWLTPAQFTGTESFTWKVCGSVKLRRLSASAMTIANFPSGVKYMLYGSETGMFGPARFPVFGSIGVRLLPFSLLAAYSVRRSHPGMTCWAPGPLGKV